MLIIDGAPSVVIPRSDFHDRPACSIASHSCSNTSSAVVRPCIVFTQSNSSVTSNWLLTPLSRSKTQRALQDSRGHKGGAVRPARPDSRRSEAPSLKATGSCLSLLIHVLMLLALCLETLVCLLEVDTLDLDTLTTNYGLRFGLFAWTLSLSYSRYRTLPVF